MSETENLAYIKALETELMRVRRRLDMLEKESSTVDTGSVYRLAMEGPQRENKAVAWMESPHGAIRANPDYRFNFPSQLLHWQIPLYMADDADDLRRDAAIDAAMQEDKT